MDKSVIIGELIQSRPDIPEHLRINFNDFLKLNNFADYAPEPYTATVSLKIIPNNYFWLYNFYIYSI